ncbi:MAG: hypothetical protein ACSHW0_09300 [Thalassotalea sp.]
MSKNTHKHFAFMNNRVLNVIGAALIILFTSTSCTQRTEASAEPRASNFPLVERHPEGVPVPTLLATRGEIMVNDDCSEDRKRGLGFWSLSLDEPNVCRVTHDLERKPTHVPIASYWPGDHENVIVEVTFRWGEPLGGKYKDQVLGIFSDLRPNKIKGHKIEAWISGSDRFTKPGLGITSSITPKVTMDEQPFDTLKANTWYTAVLEIVGNEALLRFQDRVAYVNLPRIPGPKNKITLVFGTTWHELKSVRIWHASANPEWEQMKDKALVSREAFTQGPFSY